jgi:hypothetical protein
MFVVGDIQSCNKIGKGYSLEYTEILKVFFSHITDDEVSRATKGIKNATIIRKETMIRGHLP